MASILEVVDTAVKIGLGALISGLAAYLTTKAKSDKDRQSDIAKHERDLVERISLLLFDSQSNVSKAMHCVTTARLTSDEAQLGKLVQEAAAHSLRVHEQVNNAVALAALLGNQDLITHLVAFGKHASSLHFLIRWKPQALDEMDQIIELLNATESKLMPAIRAAYQSAS